MLKVENYRSLGCDQSAARNSSIVNTKQFSRLCAQIFGAKKMKGILRQNVLNTQVRKATSERSNSKMHCLSCIGCRHILHKYSAV